MININIDISPLAINRTAMFFVVQDTVRYLVKQKNLCINLYAMNEPLDWGEFIANDFALGAEFKDQIIQKIYSALEDPNNIKNQFKSHRQNTINLVFDPLYLPFVDLTLKTIVYVLDLTPIFRPEWHEEKVSRMYDFVFKKLYLPNIEMVSISRSTARDLWANYGLPRHRIHEILLYNRFSSKINENRQPQKQFLFVGSLEKRKNVLQLVRGFALSNIAQQGFSLHIVGTINAHGAKITKHEISRTKGVTVLGRISDAALQAEYNNCCCLAYPSLWEGFGLPAIEALSQGIPLMLADTGALPEVGGKFATYVDPCNIYSIANGFSVMADKYEKKQIGLDLNELSAWLTQFELSHYLVQVTALINQICSSGVGTVINIRDEQIEASYSEDISSSYSKSKTLYRKITRSRIIVSGRILPVESSVPGDSFSLEYLYCIQQERRLLLSRSIARFMTGKIWLYPVFIFSLSCHFIRLKLTNAQIKAIVNELAIQKLKNMDK